jgi:succinate dehydrogenase/fumarate reductase flavoprotein subunit
MSETNNNNVTNVAEEVATATVDTPTIQLDVEEAIRNVTEKKQKSFLGKDRVGEALAQAKAEPAPPTPETMTIEQLAEVELNDEGGHKGIDYNKVVSSLPEEAQKLMANLRADYTRKTQELSAQRKEVEALQKSLMNSDFNKTIDELAGGETVELDPYDNASFEARIQQEVARRMQEMMAPIRQEQELNTKRQALETFKSQNPDLMDYRDEIVPLLQSNQALSLQDAYYIVKGKAQNEKLRKLEEENNARKDRMREAGLKINAGTKGSDRPPKGLKGYEIYKWLQARKT